MSDQLGVRMKEFYEQISKTRLMRRTPVAIRIDGKAFHTFTKDFKKPFDEVLVSAMQETMRYLCKNIQGCVLGYTQSDEITLILVDYKKLNSDAWFDYEVQKMCSVAASMATVFFDRAFHNAIESYDIGWEKSSTPRTVEAQLEHQERMRILRMARARGAMFDARVFNIPKEEVTNLIYWRQLDAIRNSIQAVGQANFSHSELQGKCSNEILEMLISQKGLDWNELPVYLQRGSCCVKNCEETEREDGSIHFKHYWFIDLNIPLFKEEDRLYIEDLIQPVEF